MAAITSNVKRRLFGDCPIADRKAGGLLYPSLATGILRTIARTMIHRRLGALRASDLEAIDRALRVTLGL